MFLSPTETTPQLLRKLTVSIDKIFILTRIFVVISVNSLKAKTQQKATLLLLAKLTVSNGMQFRYDVLT